MEIDETKHATSAIEMGGEELPEPAKQIMRAAGKVMTTVSYWV
jgi:ubiquinone biosynthesis monooxygenase Coq7